jgi:hypothetical protein
MFAVLLNQSPAFLTGELFLGLCLGMFGFAWVGTTRERYAVKIPVSEAKDPAAR